MPRHYHLPGFVIVAADKHPPDELPTIDGGRRLIEHVPVAVAARPGLEFGSWELSGGTPSVGAPLVLSGTVWSDAGAPQPGDIDRWLHSTTDTPSCRMLPPFAAVGASANGFVIGADSMGFRQLFRRVGPGWTAISTSAHVLARLAEGQGDRLDASGLLVQSVLGWQLGQETIFSDVVKLSPGERVVISDRSVEVDFAKAAEENPLSLDNATAAAAHMLRRFMEQYLDEHDEIALQLTGGQDSRLVLSCVPESRRKALTVLTMGERGTPDVDIAARLAARYGMRHVVQGLEELDALTPADAFARAWEASLRLDCMADPIAKSATLWAEERFPQGARLAGLGGEIARGFFYTGRVRETAVTRRRAERLARWRMFANERVDPSALDPRFAETAWHTAIDKVHHVLLASGQDWYRSTDDLYLNHRMQRWAGLSESAVCFDRQIVNPMLDDRFRAIAHGLAPTDKARGRFLARLQVALDPELAAIPLDNRPAPAHLAVAGVRGWMGHQFATGSRTVKKVRQRLAGARRPPAGGVVLGRKIVEHLRSTPETLDPLRGHGIFSDEWLDELLAGDVEPEVATLSFLVNVLVARS